MSRSLKLTDRKKLERAYLFGRERGKAAERRRMRQERDDYDDSEADHDQPRHDDDDE